MTSTTGAPTVLLRRGSRGDGVVWVQEALAVAGFDPGPADGAFGPRTETAVVAFQAAHGLSPDGIVGPLTIAALDPGSAPTGDSTGDVAEDVAEDEPTGGARTDWTAVSDDERLRYAMERLVHQYGYPVDGAAGLVGNLWAESGVIPNRIEGSQEATPMRAKDFGGTMVDFTPEQVMNRDRSRQYGPARPGVGLAQWTSPGRRSGLFAHSYNGVGPGEDMLFDMDAQLDYLDTELRLSYRGVHGVITAADVTVNAAADEVVYNFEIPGAVLDNGSKLPRSDPRVQAVFQRRRQHASRARRAHQGE